MTKEQETIVENNMALVRYVANRFKDADEFDDLFQAGCIGLIKAVQSFDESKGFAFSTFAMPVIRNQILLHLKKEKKHIRVSSINKVIDDENRYEIGDLIESSFSLDDEIVCRGLMEQINRELKKLKSRDRKIVIWYINGYKQPDIAKQIGVSQSQISRIIRGFREKAMR